MTPRELLCWLQGYLSTQTGLTLTQINMIEGRIKGALEVPTIETTPLGGVEYSGSKPTTDWEEVARVMKADDTVDYVGLQAYLDKYGRG